jgi:hypothetical protein
MAVEQTIQMLAPYVEMSDLPYHLSRLFKVPVNGIHNKAKVKVDIRRSTNDIAFPMKDEGGGWYMNKRKDFVSNEVAPAVYKEGFAISADELMAGRSFGQNPYENTELMARAQEEIGAATARLREKIKKGLELQASQILTTGALTLVDDTNATVFSETFGARTAHFPNASVSWATTGSAVPLTDLGTVANLVFTNGRKMPRRVHMNSVTLAQMKATDSFKAAMSKDYRIYNGEIFRLRTDVQPAYPISSNMDGGGVFRGQLELGASFLLDLYVYDGDYTHPYSGSATKYIPDYKVIVEADGRLDATFGSISSFGTDGRANRLIQGRMTNRSQLSDISIVAWFSPDGTVFNCGVGTRALMLPTAIDTFGCLTTSGF